VALLGSYYPVPAPELGYTFEDPCRGTAITVNPDNKTFRFTAPDGYDSGIVEADIMRVTARAITIVHRDSDITVTFRANITRDWALGLLIDRTARDRYILLDPFGFE
jgi:hypothetical protein